MPDISIALAKSSRGLIVAPAGCGKTRLIANAVKNDQCRQLILTHTHAGVRAILNHLRDVGVPSSHARVTTIDSFALRYAAAFPDLSGWRTPEPSGVEWQVVPAAAEMAFGYRAVKKVLKETYRGIYVDEYQDCSLGQHALICAVAGILPCRILGDPLQAIFWSIHKGEFLEWFLVEKEFEKIAEPFTPYRWRGKNDALGEWLLHVRKRLEEGAEIDLNAPCIKWTSDVSASSQVGVCKSLLRHRRESVIAIRKWAGQCHAVVGRLNNTYGSMETVECEDLMSWCDLIEKSTGTSRLAFVAGFVHTCLVRLAPDVRSYPDKICKGRRPRAVKPDRLLLLDCMEAVVNNGDFLVVDRLLEGYEKLTEAPVFKRRELWEEMRKTLLRSKICPDKPLGQIAWGLREITRKIGRSVPYKCISTTLLVKGLEFDHSVILDLAELEDAENAYVAMTRGSSSLTVLARLGKVHYGRPHYVK